LPSFPPGDRAEPDGLGRTRIARLWVYAIDPGTWAGTGPPAAFYRYSPDRKGERPRDHLTDFKGFLHADADAGYDALYRPTGGQPSRIVPVACWAHARRKLFEVFEATRSPIAEEGLRQIQELYAIEAESHGRPAAQRLAVRQARSVPLLAEFQQWLDDRRRRISTKTALGRALRHALSRWDALTRHTTDGRLGVDNNLAERLLRGSAVTRKNFLFVGSDEGASCCSSHHVSIIREDFVAGRQAAGVASAAHRLDGERRRSTGRPVG
jgi:transposase